MNCKQAYRFICDNIDENISSRRCQAIRKHLACCPHCEAYLESVKKTIRLYRTSPDPELPSDIHRDLIKALKLEMGRSVKPAKSGSRRPRS